MIPQFGTLKGLFWQIEEDRSVRIFARDQLIRRVIVDVIDMRVGNRVRVGADFDAEALGQDVHEECEAGDVVREAENHIVGSDDIVEVKAATDDVDRERVGAGYVFAGHSPEAVA